MSETIHEVVRERYGEMARESQSCCAPTFYDEALLTELPAEVTELSLGCGNPLESADLRPGETVLDLGSGAGIDCFLAARAVGPQGRVIGVDMTPAMLARAEAARERMGLARSSSAKGRSRRCRWTPTRSTSSSPTASSTSRRTRQWSSARPGAP